MGLADVGLTTFVIHCNMEPVAAAFTEEAAFTAAFRHAASNGHEPPEFHRASRPGELPRYTSDTGAYNILCVWAHGVEALEPGPWTWRIIGKPTEYEHQPAPAERSPSGASMGTFDLLGQKPIRDGARVLLRASLSIDGDHHGDLTVVQATARVVLNCDDCNRDVPQDEFLAHGLEHEE